MSEILGCVDPYNGDPKKRFEFVGEAGKGGFGVVEIFKDHDNDDKLVVKKLAKVIDASSANEILMLYHMNHKNIIRLYGYFNTVLEKSIIDKYHLPYPENLPMYAMILEFCDGGDLLKYFRERVSMEEIILIKVISQSLEALRYLNRNHTMHRDIKPENLLLDKYGDIKLADFGTGDKLRDDATHRSLTQQTGTFTYMAPEIKSFQKTYTFLVDIYSLGMSIYRGCNGTVTDDDLTYVLTDGLPKPIPEQYSSKFIDLIQRMVENDPKQRPAIPAINETIREIVTSAELTETNQQLLEHSLNLFFGKDGIFDKAAAIEIFEKIAKETDNECAEAVFQLARCYFYGDTVKEDKEKAILLLRASARKLHPLALKLLSFCYQYSQGVEKDLFTATQLLTIAQKFDQEASFLIGLNYYNAPTEKPEDVKCKSKEFIKQNYELAFHFFMLAKNFIPAQNYLGLCYLHGNGVEADPFEAYKYFRSAANGGSVDAMYNLANFNLEQKPNDPKSTKKAVELLTEAANNYHMGAAFKLSQLFADEASGIKDEKKAEHYAKINSSGPNPFDSMYSFALLKLNGVEPEDGNDKVEKNIYDAFSRFQLCAEHHLGAALNLAKFYMDGIGIDKNVPKAAELFEQLSAKGISDAKCYLALCYLNGEANMSDKEKAIKLLTELSEEGNALANYHLAKCFLEGNGVNEDYNNGVTLLRNAHACGCIEATYLLACCLHRPELSINEKEEARNLFEIAAKKGHPDACYELGMIFTQGVDIYIDDEKSFKLFETAEKQNHPKATTELGKFYEAGSTVQKDANKAFELYSKAHNLNDTQAEYRLGLCYLNGIGVEVCPQRARDYFEIASEKGDANSKYELGKMLTKGIGGPKDCTKGANLFEEASNLGHVEAKVELGRCYLHGIGKPMDQFKTFKLYKEASESDSTVATYKLAKLYLRGIGVRMSAADAFLLFEKLEKEKNYVPAIFELGNCYLSGVGADKNEKTGVKYLKRAAELGSSKAMNTLGVCYRNGTGLRKNHEKAFEYFQQSSEAGSILGKVNLAQCYIEGKGVKSNQQKGYSLLKETERNPAAKFRIGVCLYKGIGASKNIKEGLRLLSEAAAEDDISALCYYGKLLYKGKEKNVPQDKMAALEMFMKAAKKGHPEAMYQLGQIYEIGDCGIKPDEIRSHSYYQQSSDALFPKALYKLGTIYLGKENPQQIQNGLELLEKAASLNSIEALNELGRIYDEGAIVPKNVEKSLEFYSAARELNGDSPTFDMFASNIPTQKKSFKNLFNFPRKH